MWQQAVKDKIEMAYKEIFCPKCGNSIRANDTKAYCFCTQCGNKITLNNAAKKENVGEMRENHPIPASPVTIQDLDNKLKEVEFYYGMSVEKHEASNLSQNPTYYLKGQDILVKLSATYADDYRVWWEFCKPVDFFDPANTSDFDNQCFINESHFDKALDCAPIEMKRELIQQHDRYVSEKHNAVERHIRRKREQEEKTRKEAEAKAEKEKREWELRERQRAQQELEARQREQERLAAQERKAAEEQKKAEEALLQEQRRKQEAIANSAPLWIALSSKDYCAIENTYFEISDDSISTFIGSFMSNANNLYLTVYRIDKKKNAIYTEQTLIVKINKEGYVTKYDNKPVVIQGADPRNNELRITGTCDYTFVTDHELLHDLNFVKELLRKSKKPLIPARKVLI